MFSTIFFSDQPAPVLDNAGLQLYNRYRHRRNAGQTFCRVNINYNLTGSSEFTFKSLLPVNWQHTLPYVIQCQSKS